MAPKKARQFNPKTEKQAYKAQKKRERRALKIVDAPDAVKRKKRIRNRDPAEKQTPRTIESMRRFDETLVKPNDAEVAAEERIDEFASHFKGETTPKLYLTTSRYVVFYLLMFEWSQLALTLSTGNLARRCAPS